MVLFVCANGGIQGDAGNGSSIRHGNRFRGLIRRQDSMKRFIPAVLLAVTIFAWFELRVQQSHSHYWSQDFYPANWSYWTNGTPPPQAATFQPRYCAQHSVSGCIDWEPSGPAYGGWVSGTISHTMPTGVNNVPGAEDVRLVVRQSSPSGQSGISAGAYSVSFGELHRQFHIPLRASRPHLHGTGCPARPVAPICCSAA
jgi:hypothetical protein